MRENPEAAARPRCDAWTEQHDARLKALWAAGETAAAIVRVLNAEFRSARTRNAVIGRLFRLGLQAKTQTKRPPPPKGRRPGVSQGRGPARTKPAAPKSAQPRSAARQLEPAPLHLPTATVASLVELRPGQCRWVCAPAGAAPATFCGRPVLPGSSWCAACRAVVFSGRVLPPAKPPFDVTHTPAARLRREGRL